MTTPLKEPPAAGTEVETWLGLLERQRRNLAWKCEGVDAAGMRTTVGASTITLGGLLKHLAMVEDIHFGWRLHGMRPEEPFLSKNWDDQDWEFTSAADDTPEELLALWRREVERSRGLVDQALAEGGLDFLEVTPREDGARRSLRVVFADLVEEYARHLGHADLIRETIDGRVGEDSPWEFEDY